MVSMANLWLVSVVVWPVCWWWAELESLASSTIFFGPFRLKIYQIKKRYNSIILKHIGLD